MQNLLPQGGALPQDPATLQPWRGGEGLQAGQGDSHAGGAKDGTGRNRFCLFVILMQLSVHLAFVKLVLAAYNMYTYKRH